MASVLRELGGEVFNGSLNSQWGTIGDGRFKAKRPAFINPSIEKRINYNPSLLHREATAHTRPITCITADGSDFMTGSQDKAVKIWDASLRLKKTIPIYKKPQSLVSLETGQWLCGSSDGNVALYSENDIQISHRKADQKRIPVYLAATENGSILSATNSRLSRIAPTSPLKLQGSWPTTRKSYSYVVYMQSLDQEGNSVLLAAGAGLEVWNMSRNTYSLSTRLENRKDTNRIAAVERLTTTVVSGTIKGVVSEWDLNRSEPLTTRKVHERRISSITSITPQIYATGGYDQCVKIWDIRQEKVATKLQEQNPISHLLVTGDQELITASFSKGGGHASLSAWSLRKV